MVGLVLVMKQNLHELEIDGDRDCTPSELDEGATECDVPPFCDADIGRLCSKYKTIATDGDIVAE